MLINLCIAELTYRQRDQVREQLVAKFPERIVPFVVVALMTTSIPLTHKFIDIAVAARLVMGLDLVTVIEELVVCARLVKPDKDERSAEHRRRNSTQPCATPCNSWHKARDSMAEILDPKLPTQLEKTAGAALARIQLDAGSLPLFFLVFTYPNEQKAVLHLASLQTVALFAKNCLFFCGHENRVIGVYPTSHDLNEHGLVLQSPKTRKSKRKVYMPPFVIESLREHRKFQDAERDGRSHWDKRDFVFTTKFGRAKPSMVPMSRGTSWQR